MYQLPNFPVRDGQLSVEIYRLICITIGLLIATIPLVRLSSEIVYNVVPGVSDLCIFLNCLAMYACRAAKDLMKRRDTLKMDRLQNPADIDAPYPLPFINVHMQTHARAHARTHLVA